MYFWKCKTKTLGAFGKVLAAKRQRREDGPAGVASVGGGQCLTCARHSLFHLSPTTGGTRCHLWGNIFKKRERKRIQRVWQTIKKIWRSEKENEEPHRGVHIYCSLGRIHAGAVGYSWRNYVWWKDKAKAEEQADERQRNCYVLTVTHTPNADPHRAAQSGEVSVERRTWEEVRCWFKIYRLVSHYPSWQKIKLFFPQWLCFACDSELHQSPCLYLNPTAF